MQTNKPSDEHARTHAAAAGAPPCPCVSQSLKLSIMSTHCSITLIKKQIRDGGSCTIFSQHEIRFIVIPAVMRGWWPCGGIPRGFTRPPPYPHLRYGVWGVGEWVPRLGTPYLRHIVTHQFLFRGRCVILATSALHPTLILGPRCEFS